MWLIRISCQQDVTYKDRATLPVTTPLGNAPFLLQPPLNIHGAFGGCSKNSRIKQKQRSADVAVLWWETLRKSAYPGYSGVELLGSRARGRLLWKRGNTVSASVSLLSGFLS